MGVEFLSVTSACSAWSSSKNQFGRNFIIWAGWSVNKLFHDLFKFCITHFAKYGFNYSPLLCYQLSFMPSTPHLGDQTGSWSFAGLLVRFICPLPSACII